MDTESKRRQVLSTIGSAKFYFYGPFPYVYIVYAWKEDSAIVTGVEDIGFVNMTYETSSEKIINQTPRAILKKHYSRLDEIPQVHHMCK